MLFTEDLPIKFSENGVLLYVKVTPNASRNKLGKIMDGYLKIYVTAPPENGQANKVVIEFVSECLKISKSNIIVTKGLLGQHKILNIIGDKDRIISSMKTII